SGPMPDIVQVEQHGWLAGLRRPRRRRCLDRPQAPGLTATVRVPCGSVETQPSGPSDDLLAVDDEPESEIADMAACKEAGAPAYRGAPLAAFDRRPGPDPQAEGFLERAGNPVCL